MAPAIESYSTAAKAGDGGGSTTLTVNKPTGVAEGDLLLALAASSYSSANKATPPGDWVTEAETLAGQPNYQIFVKEAGSEPSSYDFTLTNLWTYCTIVIFRISGADPSDILSSMVDDTGGSDNICTCPSVDVPNDGSLLIRAAAGYYTASYSLSGYVEELDSQFGLDRCSQGIYSKAADSGSCGTADIEGLPNWLYKFVGATIAIAPAAAAGSPHYYYQQQAAAL
jgi:hypothetical protein